MSIVSSSSSSTSVTYATQLAQTSALKRSLNNLGTAVQNGDLTSAGATLTAFINANPQYASTSSSDTQSQDSINQDFQALADALSKNDVDNAKSAWARIKSDLAESGVSDLNNGAATTAKLLAQNKASIEQQILSNTFGTSPDSGGLLTSLLGGSSDSNNEVGLSSSLLGDWLTYKNGGSTSLTATTASTGGNLDTAA